MEDKFAHSSYNGILNAKTLVLNQTYEPLTICNLKKAIKLLYLNKAEIIETSNGRVVSSIQKSIPVPSVIRLKYFVHRPFRTAILNRKNILRRDQYKCAYCGRGDLPMTIDHIIPKTRGGQDTWENLVAACVVCNNKKGNRTPEEANMKLLIKPYKPSHIIFLKNFAGRIDDKWKSYLFVE